MRRPSASKSCSKNSLAFVFFTFAAGCGVGEIPGGAIGADGLMVPSLSSLSMDLSLAEGGLNLELRNAAGFAATAAGPHTVTYHSAAAAMVSALNAKFASPSTTPADLLSMLSTVEAKPRNEKSYVWSYQVNSGGRRYTANLTGNYLDGTPSMRSNWTMKVTASPVDDKGCCIDFKLFDGAMTGPGKGNWQFYDPAKPRGDAKLFSIAYDVKSASSKVLTYTVNSLRPKSEPWGAGTTVTYTASDDALRLAVQDSAEAGTTTIAWQRLSKAGNIVEKNGQKHCWDSKSKNFRDLAICSE